MSRFVRLAASARPAITLRVDGAAVPALAGDTLLTALRVAGLALRESEFGDGPRAGFCLMGVCQDCVLHVAGLGRVRACQVMAEEGMEVTVRG